MKTSKRTRVWVVSLVILFAVVGTFAVLRRHYPGKCEAQGEPQQTTGKEQIAETLWCPATWEPITVFTCLLAVSTCGLWVFTALLWASTSRAVVDGEKAIAAAVSTANAANRHAIEAAKTAEASRDQVNMTQKAIEYSERAWVMIDINDWGNFAFHRMGNCDLFISFLVRNTGKTPALNVHSAVWMFASHDEAEKMIDARIAEQRVEDYPRSSRMLLPNAEYDRKYGVGLDPREIKNGRLNDGTIYPVISICTTYQTFPNMTKHQTVVNYAVAKMMPGKDSDMFIKIGELVGKQNLRIETTNGGRAD